jgi:elongation factor Ts
MVDIALLKKLRQQTQVSLADCRQALEETGGDYQKALLWLKEHGLEKAKKKEAKETKQGIVHSYIHQNGRIGVLVELLCETDFVARTPDFQNLAHEIAMQIAAMKPKNTEDLLKQEYIRDGTRTIKEVIAQNIAKLGENIRVSRFERFEIGEN